MPSTISLGAMSFGSGFTRDTWIDEELAGRLVNRALDAGVNLIDTADTYGGEFGRSETRLDRRQRGIDAGGVDMRAAAALVARHDCELADDGDALCSLGDGQGGVVVLQKHSTGGGQFPGQGVVGLGAEFTVAGTARSASDPTLRTL